MAPGRDASQHLGIVGGVLADGKERRTNALLRQGLEDRVGGWPRTIVKRQDDLLVAQEVM